ncbi:MAG TPA: hypothetical protein DHB48_18485 [Sphingobium sp.]|nr:hypothetical protein [Sphingobium sp.]
MAHLSFVCAAEIGIDGAGWSLAHATGQQRPAGLLRPSRQHRSHVASSQIHIAHCDKAWRGLSKAGLHFERITG